MKIPPSINKITALSRKEARDILQNKIYILVVFVQIFIILGAVGLVVVAAVASDPALMDQAGITSALNIGLPGDLKDSSLAQYLEDEKLTLNYYNTTEEAQPFLGKKLVAIIDLSASGKVVSQVDNSNVFYPVASTKIEDAVDKFNTEKTLKNAGLNQSQVKAIQNPVNLKIIKINQDKEVPIILDSSYFVELIYGFIIPFILLLPFFLASNIVTDSVVGEKERKTFEVLLMTPLSSYMVIIGKTLPILLFSLIQSLAWMGFLNLIRVPIFNPFLLVFSVILHGIGIYRDWNIHLHAGRQHQRGQLCNNPGPGICHFHPLRTIIRQIRHLSGSLQLHTHGIDCETSINSNYQTRNHALPITHSHNILPNILRDGKIFQTRESY